MPSDEELLLDLPTPSDEAQGESMQHTDSDELPDLPALSDDGEVADGPPVVAPLLFAMPTPHLGADPRPLPDAGLDIRLSSRPTAKGRGQGRGRPRGSVAVRLSRQPAIAIPGSLDSQIDLPGQHNPSS